MNILEIIKGLEEEKKQSNKTPYYVLFIPLKKKAIELGMSYDQIVDQLNELYRLGKIKVGNTINDKFITRI